MIINCEAKLNRLNGCEQNVRECLEHYQRQSMFRRRKVKLDLYDAIGRLHQELACLSQSLEHLHPDCFDCDLEQWDDIFNRKIQACDQLLSNCEKVLQMTTTELVMSYKVRLDTPTQDN